MTLTSLSIRLELIDPRCNHRKFYELRAWQMPPDGGEFFLFRRWGRIGTQGQTKLESFNSEGALLSTYHSLLNNKSAKGYSEA